jgi:sigma54-dependent transcription regulator
LVAVAFGSSRPEQLCAHAEFPVGLLELIFDKRLYHLACNVSAAIAHVSPHTEVRLVRHDMKDPWDLQDVCGGLYDFAGVYGFDEGRHVGYGRGEYQAADCAMAGGGRLS